MVHTVKDPAIVRAIIQGVVNEVTGKTGGPLQRECGELMADAIFTSWYTSYITKSHGRADEFGDTWQPLSPVTVKRKLEGEMVRVRRGRSLDVYREPPSPSVTGGTALIPDRTRATEWHATQERLVMYLITGGMSPADAQAKANSLAWQGNMAAAQVPINIDTGHLVKSLEPGFQQKPNQVKHIGPGWIRVGTNVTYATKVHGKRPILPEVSKAKRWVLRGLDVVRAVMHREIEDRIRS